MNILSHRLLVPMLLLAHFNPAWALVEGVIGPVPLQQNPNIAVAIPQSPNSEIMISRDQYLISYNKNRRAPNWVAWKLEQNQIGSSGRSNKFQEDTELEQYLLQAGGGFHATLPTDYKNSCFDRGHQIPSEDRSDTLANNLFTFEMSNMIPQTPYLNRVIWEHFEAYTRTLVQKQNKKVFVIAGPIYDLNFGSIGPQNDIPVPSKDFKIVFILDANQNEDTIDKNTPYVAVIMPNVLKDGSTPIPNTPNCGGGSAASSAEPLASDDWKAYQTTLDEIESKASLTFTDL